MPNGQQIHIAFPKSNLPDKAHDNADDSSRHPCFKVASQEALLELQKRIWVHHVKGVQSSCVQADEPGRENSG